MRSNGVADLLLSLSFLDSHGAEENCDCYPELLADTTLKVGDVKNIECLSRLGVV
jgi:hypothetical protein